MGFLKNLLSGKYFSLRRARKQSEDPQWGGIPSYPANNGVLPLDPGSWGSWQYPGSEDGNPNPLLASKDGLDGRTTRGVMDDYWYGDGYLQPDPYTGDHRVDQAWQDTVGDYMRTSQSSTGNADGETKFFRYEIPSPDNEEKDGPTPQQGKKGE